MKLVKLLLMFLFVGVLRSQTHQTEIIPYRLVPSQDEGYGCWLEIEFIGLPQSMLNDEELLDALNRLVVRIQVPSPYSVMPKSVEMNVDIEEWKEE